MIVYYTNVLEKNYRKDLQKKLQKRTAEKTCRKELQKRTAIVIFILIGRNSGWVFAMGFCHGTRY